MENGAFLAILAFIMAGQCCFDAFDCNRKFISNKLCPIITIAFIFAALRHNIFLRSGDGDSYTPAMFGPTFSVAVPLKPRSCPMGYTASWTFMTLIAVGFVTAILLGML
jgi:hypothetical protein